MRKLAAHHARVGVHGQRFQSAALEDARVGVVHLLVTGLRGFIRSVEAVGVFHDEFLGAHETEARANFIAELGLDLIKNLRQLAVGTDLAGDQSGNDFFVGGAEQPFAFGAVVQPEQHVAGGLVTSALLPDFRRLKHRHQNFHRPGAVHFFADDAFDLAQRAHTQRQEGVKSAGQLAEQTRAQEQFVRRNLGVGRCFFERRDEGVGPAHRGESTIFDL